MLVQSTRQSAQVTCGTQRESQLVAVAEACSHRAEGAKCLVHFCGCSLWLFLTGAHLRLHNGPHSHACVCVCLRMYSKSQFMLAITQLNDRRPRAPSARGHCALAHASHLPGCSCSVDGFLLICKAAGFARGQLRASGPRQEQLYSVRECVCLICFCVGAARRVGALRYSARAVHRVSGEPLEQRSSSSQLSS